VDYAVSGRSVVYRHQPMFEDASNMRLLH